VFDAAMTRLLLAVAALAILAAGCGAAENDPNLAAAAAKTEAQGSGRFAVEGTTSESGGSDAVTCSGSAEYDQKRVELHCEYERAGTLEFIAIGRDVYMRGSAALGVAQDKWVRQTNDVDDATSIGNLSPQRLFALLTDASSQTERIGEEEVRGNETVRYRLTVDCKRAVLQCDSTATVDVWIADDGTVRRIAIDDDTGTGTFEFYDFGADVSVEAPAPADIVDIDDWNKPQPCTPSAGAPLTGVDVEAAFKRKGLVPEREDECAGDVVDVVGVRDAGSDPVAFTECVVTRTVDSPLTSSAEGLGSATVGNVRCTYADDAAVAMKKVIADLEQLVHD
jgi:hypothetical protein